MAARYHSQGFHLDYTPTEDTEAGALVRIANKTGIVNNAILADQLGAACIVGTIGVPKASATVFDDGDQVNFNESTGLAVTTAVGAGIIPLGSAVGATGANGNTEVIVLLNAEGA